MSLQKLQEKYALSAVETGADPEPHDLKAWQDSDPVMMLSKFLKQNRSQGIRLMKMDDRPTLHFQPGLDPTQQERWATANEALGLLADALPDLELMIEKNLITLPRRGSF